MGEPKPLTAYQQTYHWRNKNCGPWAREWMKKALPGCGVDDGKQSAEILEVTSVSGDCDLGQRKGKLLTIYDLELEMRWEGVAEDGSEVKGTLRIPEVSHEAIDGLSDYVFDFNLDSPSTSGEYLLTYLRTALPPVLKEKFNSFRPALTAAHGAPDGPSPSESGSTTPSHTAAPPAEVASNSSRNAASATSTAVTGKKVGSTATVEAQATLHISATDLWGLLTDEGRIPMWSRSPAKMSLNSGSPFELFGGNVRGKVESVVVPQKLVQSWQTRSPAWPSDHYGTMTISLDQGSDSTNLKFALEGVPVGQESDIERALDTFYIRGRVFLSIVDACGRRFDRLKQIGLVSSSTTRSFRTTIPRKPKKGKRKASSRQSIWRSWPSSNVLGCGGLVALSAVFVGLVLSSFSR